MHERDPVRKDDSFDTFEEVFQIAVAHDADFVLLGGDLFHDNKPSRKTLVRAIDILERHTLSSRPVAFQILSNQAENFESGWAVLLPYPLKYSCSWEPRTMAMEGWGWWGIIGSQCQAMGCPQVWMHF